MEILRERLNNEILRKCNTFPNEKSSLICYVKQMCKEEKSIPLALFNSLIEEKHFLNSLELVTAGRLNISVPGCALAAKTKSKT